MPYDGGSVIGLIILLNEVAVPHKNMQPMAYSAPASLLAEAKHQRHILIRCFLFFALTPNGVEKRKHRSIAKELIYRTISLLRTSCVPGFVLR
jgi:hypothetical protein